MNRRARENTGGAGQIDMEYRPESYWDTEEDLLANVKGEWRRRKIKAALAAGKVEDVPVWLFSDSLTEAERTMAGRVHPTFMGGEYLPEYLPGEVEIARVSLRSTTGDVISVRAVRAGGKIHYRVVDEYDEVYCLPIKVSDQPLTLGELITQIDTVEATENHYEGLVRHHWDYVSGDGWGTLQDAVEFVSVSSEFYPGLRSYFEAEGEKWRAEEEERREDWGEEEEEDDE